MRWGAPARRAGGGGGSYHILGMFIPRPIVWLIALVLFMSAGGVLLEGLHVPILQWSVLRGEAVWRGEVWRLLTWAPIQLDALGLVFGCLMIYFFGPDLLHRWGTRLFFTNYFGTAVVVGGLTCLIGRFVWTDVGLVPYQGLWPLEEAMIIAWAALFRERQILLFFVLPIAGRHLITLTIAITFIYAAMNGFVPFVPHFLAELVALLYMNVIPVRTWSMRARLAWFERQYRRRTSKLSAVDRDEPPRWTH
jgi:membrane associated rhomboid family serine protease